MPVESDFLSTFFGIQGVWLIFKLAIILLSSLYFVFSLIVVRQVNLMAETLMTEGVRYLKAFTIINAGLALGIIILLIGFLFG